MQKTARYDTIRGERVLRKFDSLGIDRMATYKAAFGVIDASVVIEAAKRVQYVIDNDGSSVEYRSAHAEYEIAKKRYQIECIRHANKNPVYFEPRANEILL